MGFFEVRNNTSEDDEYSHEFKVVQMNIYNKLKVWAIKQENVLMICPEYVHFNKSIINGMLIEDAERLEIARIENDDYYDRDSDSDSDISESD